MDLLIMDQLTCCQQQVTRSMLVMEVRGRLIGGSGGGRNPLSENKFILFFRPPSWAEHWTAEAPVHPVVHPLYSQLLELQWPSGHSS